MKRLALLLLVVLAVPLSAASPDPELTKIVTDLDRQLFDAYNTCDLETFKSFFADDVEFYHDEGGPMTGVAALTDALRRNVCGKVRRDLVSTEVYPMKQFGAVQSGVHRFTAKGEPGQGEALFFHAWRHKDNAWKITRVFSYYHHPAGK
jgi:hypothetical protein